ncbi:MAG TPA: hypothetical protein VFQ51_16075 [Vicinamibacteria bacterium]|nr:hypothetical protein [Vicinamibacteria bacterium]
MTTRTHWTAALAAAALLAASPLRAAAAGGPSLDRFKALAGEWVAAEDNEMVKKGDLVSRYVVSAGGTAVIETVFPGSPHEMVTVYYVDGSDLALTHYCMEGNQPRMRAKKTDGARLDFAFDGGANIDPARTRHMNSAWIEFVGPDEIRNQWTEVADGQTVFVAKSHLVRKAR